VLLNSNFSDNLPGVTLPYAHNPDEGVPNDTRILSGWGWEYMGWLPGRIRGRILKMLGTRNFRWLARQEK